MKVAATAAVAASLAASADAFGYNNGRTFATVQFTNKQIFQGRVDPIVSPGKVASHEHTVLGGSNFGMSSTGADLMKSTCTSANVKGDNSNYWFPTMFFQDPKTKKLERVEVFYSKVYYFMEKTQDTIKAFPVGLNMLVGDPLKRTPPSTPEEVTTTGGNKEISNVHVVCPRTEFGSGPNWPAGSDGSMAGMGTERNQGAGVGLPFRNCDVAGAPLRMDIHFPSCIKKGADLADYKNNMAWPRSADGGNQNCAEGETHVPHLFMEVYWDTPKFKERWDHSGKGPQPFVLSNGDATGYSWHADFMAAWDTTVLQNVIDNCNTGNEGMLKCPGVTENKEQCTVPDQSLADGIVDGVLDQLPGNNPISGWGVGTNPQPQPQPSDSSPSSTNAGSPSSTNGGSPSSTNAGSPSSTKNDAPTSTAKGASSRLPDATDNGTKVVENPAVSTSAGPKSSATAVASKSKTRKPKTTCPLKTVYETVTVTAAAPGAAKSEESYVRRHAHEHLGRRHH